MLSKKDGGGIIITLRKDNMMIGTIGKMLPKNELLKELAEMSKHHEDVDISVGVIADHELVSMTVMDVKKLAEVVG